MPLLADVATTVAVDVLYSRAISCAEMAPSSEGLVDMVRDASFAPAGGVQSHIMR